MSSKLTHLDEKLASAAHMLKSLAHPIRLDIVVTLDSYEMNVTTLCETMEIPQAKLSKHLAILHAAHAISLRRDGRSHYYRLKNPELAKQIIALVAERL